MQKYREIVEVKLINKMYCFHKEKKIGFIE